MKRNTHNSTISINQSTPEVSHKDAVTSTESHPSLDVESTSTNSSTSRELHGASSPLSMRKIFDAFTSYVLSSEDEAVIHYTPKDLGYFKNDREPMFFIVDSNCASNPSSNELLIDKRFQMRDPVLKRHFNKNVKPVEVPSTSRDLGNYLLQPAMMKSDSADEMQMVDINLQGDNGLLIGADSEYDNDSVVISCVKNKDIFLDLEEYSDEALDVLIPSFPVSPRPFSYDNLLDVTHATEFSDEEKHHKLKEAIDFLHHDHEFLIAAEQGDENLLQMLIEKETNIQVMDHLGRNALHMAVCSGYENVVALLLAAGVQPNVKDNLGMTPLCLCLMRSPSSRLAQLLLDNGAVLVTRLSPMDTGLFLQFVMMCIPTNEEEKILRILVSHGALVNDPEAPGGRQALHFAAMSNNTYLINILVDLGAKLFDVNHRNETPKQVAVTFKCKEAYALLQHLEQVCVVQN